CACPCASLVAGGAGPVEPIPRQAERSVARASGPANSATMGERRAVDRAAQRAAAGRLHCVECGWTSPSGHGWRAIRLAGDEHGDPPEVAVYCCVCTVRALYG